MDNPIAGDIAGAGGLFLGSSAGIHDLHRLPPMPLFSDDEDTSIPTINGEDKKISPWQRMKWTDEIVRLLISLVSSIGDDNGSAMQKKGKWKMISKLMMQKGSYVSPQQCEDKFNDLNKRYKRLNEILGRGTSCQVVENPSLLDSMSHVSQKGKDDVKRILSSKHLFYREMCSYHNSKVGFLKCGEEEGDENEEEEEEEEDEGCGSHEFGKLCGEIDMVVKDAGKSVCERRVWIRKRILKLQEERVGIQSEAFELEKRRMKWKRFCNKKDWELESLRMKNEKLSLENERMTLRMRHKELELDSMRGGEMLECFGNQVEDEGVRAQSGV